MSQRNEGLSLPPGYTWRLFSRKNKGVFLAKQGRYKLCCKIVSTDSRGRYRFSSEKDAEQFLDNVAFNACWSTFQRKRCVVEKLHSKRNTKIGCFAIRLTFEN